MKESLQVALDTTELVYRDIVDIANKIVSEATKEVDDLIKGAANNVETLSNDSLRNLIIDLSLKSFMFSDIKEKSGLKAEVAETLRKEAYAKSFNATEGAVAARENQAIIATSEQVVVEAIYNMISSLFKTKLDECHRVVDALKTVLMSRNMEAKLTATLYESEGK